VEYLRGNATASATGLFVICRYLSRIDGGQTEAVLRRDLQPLRAKPTGGGDVVRSSLDIGTGLRVLQAGPRARLTVDPVVAVRLATPSDRDWEWFRAELLRRISQQAASAVASKAVPSDLAVGMTWFLQLDPLKPLAQSWGDGAEQALTGLRLKAIERSEQWRPFRRWVGALGLAREVRVGRGSGWVVPDASSAIADQLADLPQEARAQKWLAALTSKVPVLGASALLSTLPARPNGWSEVPPSVALGLLKLEKSGVIRMGASDDASDIVTVGLGGNTRQVGTITVVEVAA
jgi:hypothetical protein